VAAGTYSVRCDAVAEDQPQEVFTLGPVVALTVPAVNGDHRWWIVAVAVAVIVVGAIVAVLIARRGDGDGGAGSTLPSGPATDPEGPDVQVSTPVACRVLPNAFVTGRDTLEILVTLRNGGPGGFGSTVPMSVSGDTVFGRRPVKATGALGSLSAVAVDLVAADYNRFHLFTITADPDNTITESNESNNVLHMAVALGFRPTREVDIPCAAQ
jgi:hypothetical protein